MPTLVESLIGLRNELLGTLQDRMKCCSTHSTDRTNRLAIWALNLVILMIENKESPKRLSDRQGVIDALKKLQENMASVNSLTRVNTVSQALNILTQE
jgi:hypothetical protein